MSEDSIIHAAFQKKIINIAIERVTSNAYKNKNLIKNRLAKQMPESLKLMKDAGYIKGGIASDQRVTISLSDEMLNKLKSEAVE